MSLNDEERYIISEASKGNMGLFIEYYFRLPFSGTWFTTEDRVEQYDILHQVWVGLGKPDEIFDAEIGDKLAEIRITWDPYYGEYPMFLLHHGFKTLEWMQKFLSPGVTHGVATTGTGSGKTAGVAVYALACCAVIPGFRFHNAAPTQYHANLMLGEITKWVGTDADKFRKFIKLSKGANELWNEREGYPVITIQSPLNPKIQSSFSCQTVGQNANSILGREQDWINIEEAQLMYNITDAEPKLATRLRGTRATGLPRWSKQTWISNPGDNPEFIGLIEKYKELEKDGMAGVLVLEDVPSDVNRYITKRQLEKQRLTMSQREIDRWMGGQMSAVREDSEITTAMLEACKSDELTKEVDKVGKFADDLGLVRYELPHEPDRHYVVVGDVGKSPRSALSSMNVPAIMVFDVTNFLEEPCRLVALRWIDGKGSYEPFVTSMKYLILKYRARGYYDAGNVQTAFEDVGGFEDVPYTEPVSFAGHASIKKWAVAVTSILMQNGLFEWPYIKALWYQGRIFRVASKKNPDDLIACLLVFSRVLQIEGTLWNRFVSRFDWDVEDIKEDEVDEEDDYEVSRGPVFDRHTRIPTR